MGKLIPLLGLTICLFMAVSLNHEVIVSGILFLFSGFIFYFFLYTYLNKNNGANIEIFAG